MKEFERWHKREQQQHSGLQACPQITNCDVCQRNTWRAALERVIKQMDINPNMRNMELEDWIEEELKGYKDDGYSVSGGSIS